MALPLVLKLSCFAFVVTTMWLSMRFTAKAYERPDEPASTLDPSAPGR